MESASFGHARPEARRGDRLRRLRAGGVQAAHRLSISAQHRDRQRGLTAHVFRFQVRAELDQEIQDVVALSVDGEMQRRLPVFEARHAAIERFRILLHQLLNQIQVADATIAEKMWWRAPRSSRSDTTSRRDASICLGSSPGAR